MKETTPSLTCYLLPVSCSDRCKHDVTDYLSTHSEFELYLATTPSVLCVCVCTQAHTLVMSMRGEHVQP